MHALIIANGPLPQPALKLAAAADLIVCADGGANEALRAGITPSVIIGDFDSVLPATLAAFAGAEIVRITEQESTDLEKAIRFVVARNIRTADIVGALGRRTDHTLGTLGCFRRFAGTIELRLIDELGALTLLPRKASFAAFPGEKISLVPVGRCAGITTEHLRYPLRNEALEPGVRDGISNEATGPEVSVSYESGTLLLYRFHR